MNRACSSGKREMRRKRKAAGGAGSSRQEPLPSRRQRGRGSEAATPAAPTDPLRAPRREQAPRISGQQRAASQQRVRDSTTGSKRTQALEVRARGLRPAPAPPPQDFVERRAHVEEVKRTARTKRVEHEPHIPKAERSECASERSAKVARAQEGASLPSLRRALLYPAAKEQPEPRGPKRRPPREPCLEHEGPGHTVQLSQWAVPGATCR